jgi:hypothetical protein
MLLQHPDDLIFREPCSLHLSVLQEGRQTNPRGGNSQWQVSAKPKAKGGSVMTRAKERKPFTLHHSLRRRNSFCIRLG